MTRTCTSAREQRINNLGHVLIVNSEAADDADVAPAAVIMSGCGPIVFINVIVTLNSNCM